jgi:predicted CoA-binding protein
MTDDELRELYRNTHVIATVGLSANPERPGYSVPQYLQEHGYRIIPVNPALTEALGEKAYPDLASVPEKVDIVQIFRRAEDVPPIVEQAIAIGAKVIWMQLGVSNEEAAARAEQAGLTVVMDRCLRAEHRRLFGE